MSFADAVRTCLTKYATFSGRARRSEYWWFLLFDILVWVALRVVDQALGTGVLPLLGSLALLLPSLAVLVRRLHDIGRTGWWVLINLVPIVGGLVLLVFAVTDSSPAGDIYGPSPKYANAA